MERGCENSQISTPSPSEAGRDHVYLATSVCPKYPSPPEPLIDLKQHQQHQTQPEAAAAAVAIRRTPLRARVAHRSRQRPIPDMLPAPQSTWLIPWVYPRPPVPSVTALPPPCCSSTAQLAEQGHRADRLESAGTRSRVPRRRNPLAEFAVPWSLRMFAAPEVRQWAPSSLYRAQSGAGAGW